MIFMDPNNESPLIVGFVSDLFFQVKIENAAEHMNYRMKWIEDADQVASPELDIDLPERQFGEHLVGRGAVLLDDLTQWKPALIIFDLNDDRIPWRDWISMITSVSATRRIPVICFGSHRDVEAMQAAKTAGAKAVLARSKFVRDLPGLIEKYAFVIDIEAIAASCENPLPLKAILGLEEFNRGEYFEAHEHLEEAWNEDDSPGRDLFRAVLQVAVAYLHITNRNYRGAAKMFLRMRQWLDPLPEVCRGIDIARLRDDAQVVHDRLIELGSERIDEFDLDLLQPVHYSTSYVHRNGKEPGGFR
jgi:predicted metal-dependent hydrolase